MKTLATIVITAAICCGFFLVKDVTNTIQTGEQARDRFAQACNEADNVTILGTEGLFHTTLRVRTGSHAAEADELLDETLHSQQADDKNFRTRLRQLGFHSIEVDGIVAPLPNTEDGVGPAKGRQFEFKIAG